MAWPIGYSPPTSGRQFIMSGLNSSTAGSVNNPQTVPVAVDPSNGAILTESVSGGNSLPSSFQTNQATVGTSASALPSNSLTQGVIVQALSTNTVSIFIGPSGVTTSTGFELQAGQATSIAVNNTSAIYAISGTAGQGLCFVGS